MTAVVVVWASIATLLNGYKWLLVAQKEHYIPGRTTAMARQWARSRATNLLVLALVVVSAVGGAAFTSSWLASLSLLLSVLWPIGLPILIGTHIVWTRRMTRLAATFGAVSAVYLVSALMLANSETACLASLASPLMVDLSALLVRPLEKHMARPFVESAQAKLAATKPTLVAITGSYGKTTTKAYTAHILSSRFNVMASPSSYNNLLGLSRAINERMMTGTEVVVAEMGTYGPGEIREMCRAFPPDISAITVIGEAHLERMKTPEAILAAKSEITENAPTIALNTDDSRLKDLGLHLQKMGRSVYECSARSILPAGVSVVEFEEFWTVIASGTEVCRVPTPPGGHPSNLAVAVGISLAAGCTETEISVALKSLPGVQHRFEPSVTDAGILVFDDTYNSNPKGAEAAVNAASEARRPDGTLFVITPGMMELGPSQYSRNREFAKQIAEIPTAELIVVGRTNRKALFEGSGGRAQFTDNRGDASRYVWSLARPGDAVLFENDLPEYYP
jgi:UDP-N-acetylmuramoyl-tripeptide--D-alanyl-D-alanine ligase